MSEKPNKQTFSSINYTRRPRTNTHTQPDTRKQDIEGAYKEGMLLAHMLEMPLDIVKLSEKDSRTQQKIKNMFDVMAIKPMATHNGFYHNRYVAKPEGMQGMATTVLAEGIPGNLWTRQSSIGLLFDGRDKTNIKLEHFYPFDARSDAIEGLVSYRAQESFREMNPVLTQIVNNQHNNTLQKDATDEVLKVIDLNQEDNGKRAELTKIAIQEFLQARREGKLPDYEQESITHSPEDYPLINETTISAKLKGLKGIVILSTERNPAHLDEFKKARAMASWLSKEYPDIILTPPPIVVYDGQSLVEPDIHQEKTFTQFMHRPEIQNLR